MIKRKPKLTVITGRLPDDTDLLNIPLAHTTEYELSDHETKVLRQRIYAINKNNVAFRFRTMREAPMLLVMKIRK
jgi:hypothetical protein